eukprot:CAMPEP_0197443244 /NCGR_PEP_ID=MMETSP1175-20131217/9028_1 /TAXON_ID=1003142 /ORGANISM="Triceratium dubium, Strain CCMP147" /LENGTH=432 /DNA_ID=CAMNT_0042973845 /DNA_START=187 /DNA_END=1485 /DNA_ORIENTATION=-
MSYISVDTSFLECSNDSLWLLSEKAAEENTFLIVGGALAALIAVYMFLIYNHFSMEKSPFKMLLGMCSVRRRELWMNLSFAVALVALNLLLLGGIQKKFKETFTVIMTVFGGFWLCCSITGIYAVASRLKRKKGASMVKNATEFMTGNADISDMRAIISTDRYQDFGNDLFGTVWLGVAQMILLTMYVCAVYADLSEEASEVTKQASEVATRRILQGNETQVDALEQFVTVTVTARKNIYAPFYALALFVQIGYVFGKDTVKDRFRHFLFWGKAYRLCWDKKSFDWRSREASTINPIELIIRSMLSILVNDVGLILLLLVLPLQLSAVNRKDCFDFADKISDFVLNAVAIYYVVEVDNMEEKVYRISEDKDSVITPKTARADTEEDDGDEEGESTEGTNSNTKKESFFFDEYDIEEGDERLSKRSEGLSVKV